MMRARLKQAVIRNTPRLSNLLWGYSPLFLVESLDLEPIAACNLRCAFCQVPGWDRAKTAPPMEMDLFRRIVDPFPNLKHVKLQGMGEPLINSRVPDMVDYLTRRNIRSSVISNGVLLRRDLSERLLEKGLTALTISFDGASKETYERARLRSKFERVCENMTAFAEAKRARGRQGASFGVACLVSEREILEEVPLLVELAADVGADSVHVKSRIKKWRREDGGQDYAFDSVHINERYSETVEVIARAKETAARSGVRFSYSEDDRYTESNPCPWPWFSLYVSTEGKVVPCCAVGIPETWSMGDLTTESIRTLWNSKTYRELRRRIYRRDLPLHCRECYR